MLLKQNSIDKDISFIFLCWGEHNFEQIYFQFINVLDPLSSSRKDILISFHEKSIWFIESASGDI